MNATAKFRKPAAVTGNSIVFRNATVDDAEFILGLRTDEAKSRFLSKTSAELSQQVSWLERYQSDDSQVYFVIFDMDNERVGTVRLYDQQGCSFCWGSWILKQGSPSSYAVESALMVYQFALSLGFEKAHFDVRKGNESVWKFHERFGAQRVGETEEDYLFSVSRDAIEKSLERYRKYLPNGITIDG